MICEFSGRTSYVSDYSIICKKTRCPKCDQMVKISIPDKELNGNIAKFGRHSKVKKN
jgi:hypothetical protein